MKTFSRFVTFLFFWIFFILPAEFGIHIFVMENHGLEDLIGTIIIYTFLLCLYYVVMMRGDGFVFGRNWKLVECLMLGSFWLFVMEWMLIGNSPNGNPDAIQTSMFIWWVMVFIFPKIYLQDEYKSLRISLLWFHIILAIVAYTMGYITSNIGLSIFIYAYGILGYVIWVFQYISKKG